VVEEAEELESYRAQVAVELDRRIERVRRIDSEIAAVMFRLEALQSSGRVLAGNTARLLSQVSFREKMKKDREKLDRERAEAIEDVKRAQERLAQVDAEIAEKEYADVEELQSNSDGDE
jgi:uncharacterized protein (DUF2236 family)